MVEKQLLLRWEVHPVKARVSYWRRGNTEMHLLGSRLLHKTDELLCSSTTNDGIVHQDHDASLANMPHWVELAANFQVPVLLAGSNERTTNIGIPEESEIQHAFLAYLVALLNEAHGGMSRRIRHGDHNGAQLSFWGVRNWVLPGQLTPLSTADLGDIVTEDHRVRSGEVDVLEYALGDAELRRQREASECSTLYCVLIDDDHFPGHPVPHVFGLAKVQSTGFRSNTISIGSIDSPLGQTANTQGTETVGVPDSNHACLCHNDHREGTLSLAQGVEDLIQL
mmetsp:Transcript_15331/g.23870  ORF Transcript_15331/g.23870 Transcript_15331/m.23870 type:complete len:281 (-) Transcript_15331:27-869(-)